MLKEIYSLKHFTHPSPLQGGDNALFKNRVVPSSEGKKGWVNILLW
jgi:hypothetical protein